MKLSLLLTLTLGLLFSPPVWAADGDTCAAHSGTFVKLNKGLCQEIACVQICDDADNTEDTGTIGDCTEFNFNTVTGTPDLLVFEYEEDPGATNCTVATDPTFTLTTGPVAGGVPSYDIDTSPVTVGGTTTRVVVDLSTNPLDTFLFIAFNNGSGAACTNVDVRMHMLTRAR